MYVSVFGRGLGGALSVDGSWPPLPTCLQRYCDPASLAVYVCVLGVGWGVDVGWMPLPTRRSGFGIKRCCIQLYEITPVNALSLKAYCYHLLFIFPFL